MYVKIDTAQILSFPVMRDLYPNVAFPLTGPDGDWMEENGLAAVVEILPPEDTPDTAYFLDGAESVGGQWVTKWSSREKTPEETASFFDSLKDELARIRYEEEISGVKLGDVLIQTDRETRVSLYDYKSKAAADNAFNVKWKSYDAFVTLSAADIITAADAVSEHVRKCFDAEAFVFGQIDTYSSLEEVRTAFLSAKDA